MAPNKKKKKPLGNPARGFATTSIASKPKQEQPVTPKETVGEPKKESTDAAELPAHRPAENRALVRQPEQTPEELEAQLEHDELQLLVEKLASKAGRESRRQVAKIYTDRRTLPAQSETLAVHDWLPYDVLEHIISLARVESNDSNLRRGQQSLLKILSEEDAISKLWVLDLTLRDLGFTAEHIEPVLRWICANAVSVDAGAGVWGLQEALEWLVLQPFEGHSFSYLEPKTGRPGVELSDSSRPNTPVPEALALDSAKSSNGEVSRVSTPSPTFVNCQQIEPGSGDADISDLDSDLELDQLVPTYLKIKAKLFELDPDAAEATPRKQVKNVKNRTTGTITASHSPAVRKLRLQLKQLESDALFDQADADAQWPDRRNRVAQLKAAQRREQNLAGNDKPGEPNGTVTTPPVLNVDADSHSEAAGYIFEEDDGGLLGDMFSAVPSQSGTIGALENGTSEDVSLRDFGKQTGLTPRRLLEEAIRSRDPGARVTYKLVSPTTYSCRHALIIFWSKAQNIEHDTDIPGVKCSTSTTQARFEATTIATVSVDQSESFIATAALFSICAASAKEEKVYLRLPSNWRDLYKELLDYRKKRIDTLDRETIKRLRAVIQDQLENEESDGVVLTSRFRLRNQAASSSNSSTSGSGTPTDNSSVLKQLWEQKASNPAFQRMLFSRSTLPVFGFRESILSTIENNQVTIVCGETGCGKSTQIPSFILEHELSLGRACKIYCTEPRRISAISLAQRVSEELGEAPKDLGTPRSVVGYAIRLESKTSAQTKLVYATVGVVLRMLESSRGLDEVTHLIIDEVHERSIDTDFLLIIIRSLMVLRPELKVILMSATVDAQRFSKYLNNAPVLNVPGRTYPVKTMFLEDAIEKTHYNVTTDERLNDSDTSGNEDGPRDTPGIPTKLSGYSAATRNALTKYDEYAIDYELIVRLIELVAYDAEDLSKYSNAFLIFLPGIAEIRQLNDILVAHPSFKQSWLIYPLHSTISSEEQQAAFLMPPAGARKIVLATNIAETGVTIPDITCVIDTGKHKEMRFDERRQLSRLTQSFISRANAKQRRGRAGRVQEGVCFHLFTRYRHDSLMTDQQTPEMLRLSLQELVMRTKICKLGDIEKTLSEALDPPLSRNIRRAIDALVEVEALTPNEELTPLGRQLAKLPLDAHLGKLVLLSSMFSCVDAVVTIAAILSSKSPFLTPFGARQRADAARVSFKKGDSDLLTAYNAYKSWKNVCTTPGRSEAQFCRKYFLSSQNLGNIEDLKVQLLATLNEAGFIQMSSDERRTLSRYRSTPRYRTFVTVPPKYDMHSENDIVVNSVIAAAFYPKILTREGKGWRNIANNQTVSLAPTSVNKVSAINPSSSKYLSYYHIMQSSNRLYNAHSTSIVHPLPLLLMVGGNVDFKLHAGIISLPGNALRFSVRDWQATVAVKVLRRRVKDILTSSWKNPGRQLTGREREWMGLLFKILEERFERELRIRERAGAKSK